MPAGKTVKKTKIVTDESAVATARKATVKTSTYSPELITRQLSELKLKVSQSLSEITDELLSREEDLRRLEKEIEAKKKELTEIEEVRLTGKTLVDLLKQIDQTKLAWEREKEEHEYQIKTAAKRQEEEFAQRKSQQDLRLEERELTVKKAEVETEQLRLKTADLEKKLAETIEKQKVNQQNLETDKRISELKTTGLEQAIRKLETDVQYWRGQAEKAANQVKDMAVEALKSKTPSVDSN
jgi:chromosome segregation ATPase